jgi:hypothetical protein
MSLLQEAALVAGKDLRIEARSRVTAQQILPFGLVVLLLFAFALDPDRGVLTSVAPGLFWVTVLLGVLLAVGRAYSIEADNGARDSLRLSGLDSSALFLGKAGAVAIELVALEALLAAGVVVLFNVHGGRDRRVGGRRYPLRRPGRRTACPRDTVAGVVAPGGGPGAARGHSGVGVRHQRCDG